jgi:outer membrane protein TolC
VARSQALENLCVAALVVPDLPYRRKQAGLGVVIAQAGVQQAEVNTIYGVEFGYLTAVYAAQQQKVADQALSSLKFLRDLVQEAIKAERRPDISTRDLERIDAYILLAEGRREEAVEGAQRALSALREALGVCPDYPLQLAHTDFPAVNAIVAREQLVAIALARRAELVQATGLVELTSLEVCAQNARHAHVSVETFASGGDLHSQPVPPAAYGPSYRPGAVGPEMPMFLRGKRADRVEQAKIYNARAEAMLEKTRNLITLEVEQTFYQWAEANRKLPRYEQAASKAFGLYKGQRSKFNPLLPKITPATVTIDQLLQSALLSTQLQLRANEARYQRLLSLAELERVTGGGFSAGLDTPAKPPAQGKK